MVRLKQWTGLEDDPTIDGLLPFFQKVYPSILQEILVWEICV